jgi:hypothetical protein
MFSMGAGPEKFETSLAHPFITEGWREGSFKALESMVFLKVFTLGMGDGVGLIIEHSTTEGRKRKGLGLYSIL